MDMPRLCNQFNRFLSFDEEFFQGTIAINPLRSLYWSISVLCKYLHHNLNDRHCMHIELFSSHEDFTGSMIFLSHLGICFILHGGVDRELFSSTQGFQHGR